MLKGYFKNKKSVIKHECPYPATFKNRVTHVLTILGYTYKFKIMRKEINRGD